MGRKPFLLLFALLWVVYAMQAADLTVTSNLDISTNDVYNNVTVQGTGTLTIKTGATVTASFVQIESGGLLIVEGGATMTWGGTGNLSLMGTCDVYGDLHVIGNIFVQSSGILNIKSTGEVSSTALSQSTGSINIEAGGNFDVGANFSNFNPGVMTIHGAMDVSGDLLNQQTIQGTGTLKVDGTVTNTGTIFTSLLASPDCTVECSEAALPVSLISFKCDRFAGRYLFQWYVASEINNDFFTLAVSVDDEIYHDVGVVQGRGTVNQPILYEYSLNSLSSYKYVRLSQTDFDGTERVIGSLTLEQTILNQTNVYPTVIAPGQTVLIRTDDRSFRWTVYDLRGRKCLAGEAQGYASFSLSQTGLHILKVNDEIFKVLASENP